MLNQPFPVMVPVMFFKIHLKKLVMLSQQWLGSTVPTLTAHGLTFGIWDQLQTKDQIIHLYG
jgi:hypothetical protein